MVKSLDENRQRWDGDKGLAYWRNKLHIVLGWQQRLDVAKEEIDQAFANYRILKEQIVATPQEITKEVYKKIQQAANEIFNSIRCQFTHYGRETPRNRCGPVFRSESTAYARKDEIIERTELVDDMVARLKNLRMDVSELINRLGE